MMDKGKWCWIVTISVLGFGISPGQVFAGPDDLHWWEGTTTVEQAPLTYALWAYQDKDKPIVNPRKDADDNPDLVSDPDDPDAVTEDVPTHSMMGGLVGTRKLNSSAFFDDELDSVGFFWESTDGTLVGIVTSEGQGSRSSVRESIDLDEIFVGKRIRFGDASEGLSAYVDFGASIVELKRRTSTGIRESADDFGPMWGAGVNLTGNDLGWYAGIDARWSNVDVRLNSKRYSTDGMTLGLTFGIVN